jgi:hypothetical protein
MNERNLRRKLSKPQERIFNPQYGRQFCYRENLSMARGKPQQTEMTA